MRNIYILIAAISLLVLVAIFLPKSCEKVELVNNTYELQQIDSLKVANDSIKALSDSLLNNYSEAKIVKDSLVYRIKTRYISVYDTISNEVVECLPKIHVDSLIYTYENLILDADTIIKVQSIQINNLEQQDDLKDTIILSHKQQVNELQKSVKKEKRNKFLFGIGGFISGVIVGKL